MQVLLPPERIEMQFIEVIDQLKVERKNHKLHAEELHAKSHAKTHAKPEKKEITDNSKKVTDKLSILLDRVKKSNQTNALFIEVRQYLTNPEDHDQLNIYLRGSRVSNSLLYKNNKLWVNKNLRLDVIQKVHN